MQVLAGLVALRFRGRFYGGMHLGNVLPPLRVAQTKLGPESDRVWVQQDPEGKDAVNRRRLDCAGLDGGLPGCLISISL